MMEGPKREEKVTGDLFSNGQHGTDECGLVATLQRAQQRRRARKPTEASLPPSLVDTCAVLPREKALMPRESGVMLIHPLPLWREAEHAAPNLVVRSALFNIRPNQIRRRLISPSRKELVMTAGETQLFMAGEELRQDDADLFFHLLHYARVQARQGGWVHFRARQLLVEMGWQTSGKGYDQLKRSIERMANVLLVIEGHEEHLDVQFGEGFSMLGGFAWKEKDGGEGLWRVYISREVINLFWLRFYSRFEWELRKRLNSRTAKWLHLVYASYAEPPVMSVHYLNALSGSSTSRLKKFREVLAKGHDELVAAGFLESWDWVNRRKAVKVNRLARPCPELPLEAS